MSEQPLQFTRPGPARRRMKTVIGVCLDESSSMYSARQQTIDAFNRFLVSQFDETADECELTLFKFNSVVSRVSRLTPIRHVPHLTMNTYVPGGSTALYDAVAHTIAEIERDGSDADRVVIVVITDGEENASVETTHETMLSMIAAREKTGKWTFVYLSASPQAFTDGAALGISKGNTVAFNTVNVAYAAQNLGGAMRSLRRSVEPQTMCFTGSVDGADWSGGADLGGTIDVTSVTFTSPDIQGTSQPRSRSRSIKST